MLLLNNVTDAVIKKLTASWQFLIISDDGLKIPTITKIIRIDKKFVQEILHKHFSKQNGPTILTFAQQKARKNISTDTLHTTQNHPKLLEKIITQKVKIGKFVKDQSSSIL